MCIYRRFDLNHLWGRRQKFDATIADRKSYEFLLLKLNAISYIRISRRTCAPYGAVSSLRGQPGGEPGYPGKVGYARFGTPVASAYHPRLHIIARCVIAAGIFFCGQLTNPCIPLAGAQASRRFNAAPQVALD